MGNHVVTGLGPDGRSTILSNQPRVPRSPGDAGFDADDAEIRKEKDFADLLVAKLYEMEPEEKIERPATGHLLPTPIPPGGMQWIEMKYEGAISFDLHRTDTIDLHYILSGEVELILENGSVRVSAGDTVVVPAILHAWRSTKGWSSNIFAIGLAAI